MEPLTPPPRQQLLRQQLLRHQPRRPPPALILGATPALCNVPAGLLSRVCIYSVDGAGLSPPLAAGRERLVAVCPRRYSPVRERCLARPELEVFVGHPGWFSPPARLLRSFGPRAQPLRQLAWRRRGLDRWLRRLPVRAGLNAYLLNQREMAFESRAGFNFQGGGVSVALQLAVAHGHRELWVHGLGDAEARYDPLAPTSAGKLRAALEPVFATLQVYLEPMAGCLVDCTPGSPLQFVSHEPLLGLLAALARREPAVGGAAAS